MTNHPVMQQCAYLQQPPVAVVVTWTVWLPDAYSF